MTLLYYMKLGQSNRRFPGNALMWEGSGMPTVLTLFNLVRNEREILANITKEGKKLMATADSVFTEVTNDLISGTIVVTPGADPRTHGSVPLHLAVK